MQEATLVDPIWSLRRKIGFRFCCCFFILYTFPFPLNSIPFSTGINEISEKILGWYYAGLDYVTVFWHWLIPAVGKGMNLNNPISIFTNGSGDTTYDYVLLFTQVLISVIVCIIWTVLDRNRKSYNAAYYWLCVLLRYFLASMMLGYGFAKVFHLQMPYPYLSRLVQPYGDSSPMGLVWTYIGQSKAFSVIVGMSEVICGLLLFFRKTTLLGALFSLIVMGNVMAVNFCYDVPVKLFSSVLEIMALYLAAPYLKKIFQVFVQHKPTYISNYDQPVFTKKWFAVSIKILKFLVIADALFYGIKGSIDQGKQYGDDAPRPPLYGIYNTELVLRNNDTIVPLTTDTTRWRQIIIQTDNFARIKLMNDTVRNYNFKVDTVTKKAVVYPNWDTLNKMNFNYTKDSEFLILSGRIKNDSMYMRLKKYDEKKFRLMNRGFHWINEYPYNR
ncbi:MAG: DoxX family protein [Ferruginibacter sp.]